MLRLWTKLFVYWLAFILSTSYVGVVIWNCAPYSYNRLSGPLAIVVWGFILYWYVGKDIDEEFRRRKAERRVIEP